MEHPFRLERALKFEIRGKLEEGYLTVGDIVWVPERSKWACEWSMSFVHPETGKIFGEDPLHALTATLDFISALIRGSEHDGLTVWWKTKGDHCGVVFPLSEERRWTGLKL